MMSKDIKRVRDSINRRKKKRELPKESYSSKDITPVSFPEEEEKHGYEPVFTDYKSPKKKKKRQITGFVTKGMLSVMLFLVTAFILQTDSEMFTGTKQLTKTALTEEFPFARVNQWYQEAFGEPMAISSATSNDKETLALPVNGTVSESFQANGTGIMLQPKKDSEVSALQSGVVTFAGNDHDTNRTVVVQHADNSETVYGNLDSINVHLYQFIDNGEKLGEAKADSGAEDVYFAIEKDDKYIDPVQVIQVDDRK